RARDREERDARLAGDGARQEGLAGAGRADQQNALRRPPAEPRILPGVLEEPNDLAQLLLGLVDAGDIVEGDLGVGLDIDLALAAADRHEPAAAEPGLVGKAPEDEDPQTEEQEDREDPGKQVAEEVALDLAAIGDAVLAELLDQRRIVDAGGDEAGLA